MSIRLWKRYVVLFLIGGLAGGAMVLFLFGHEMEDMILVNRNLKLLNERLLEEIEGLKQSERVAKKKREVILEEIRVTVLDPKPEPIFEAGVSRELEKDLVHLKGKKAEQVGEIHDLLHQMLRRREYIVEGKVVEVRVKTVVISRVLHLFVTAVVKPDVIGAR
jgi:hypothetical protein